MSGQGFPLRTDQMILDYQEHLPAGAVHRWDARFKLILLVCVIALNVGLAELWLSSALFGLALVLILWSRVPLRLLAIFFLAPAWATLIVFVGFSLGFGVTPVFEIGPLTVYREGLWDGLAAAARVATDMSWLALVFLTTPMTRLLPALRSLRVPEVLVDAIAMAFRYAFHLFDQFHRMLAAARARGGLRSYRMRLESIGHILAQILIRAYDRAAAIQSAMIARGALASAEQAGPGPGPAAPVERVEDPLAPLPPEPANPEAPLLAARHVSFSYVRGGRQEISDLSLTVTAGEIVVLCGPNGCGKSTLLKLLAGILSHSSGEIRLLGRTLDRKLRNAAFRYVGLLFQDPDDQIFCTHVREDVAYGPVNMGLAPAAVDALVEQAIVLTEIAHLADKPTHRLSYGEMKRVALAGLIAMRVPLLLLDEPSAFLDPAATRQLVSIVQKLHRDYAYSFIVVTHDMDLAAQLATRVVVMEEGKIIADGAPRQILTDQTLLRQARLEAPVLTRLFGCLDGAARVGPDRIPVTLDEAAALLTEWSNPKP